MVPDQAQAESEEDVCAFSNGVIPTVIRQYARVTRDIVNVHVQLVLLVARLAGCWRLQGDSTT